MRPFTLCFCIFNVGRLIKCVFSFHPVCTFLASSPNSTLWLSFISLWNLFWIWFGDSNHRTKLANAPIDGVKLGYMIQIPFTQARHDSWFHDQEIYFLYFVICNFIWMHHHLDFIWSSLRMFLFEFNFKSIFVGCHLLDFFNHFLCHKP
jgi:hypothetical protein